MIEGQRLQKYTATTDSMLTTEVVALCHELINSSDAQHCKAIALLTDLLSHIDMISTTTTTIGSGYEAM